MVSSEKRVIVNGEQEVQVRPGEAPVGRTPVFGGRIWSEERYLAIPTFLRKGQRLLLDEH
ncbi:MAG: hypothetical protein KJ950_03570 [Proteobacteria bacterium]|nr:hypothetical protein [Pseudomonadota bacterium]MBU1686398.1 hypothetical protein [Pseudomonadota bacterium]